MYKMSELKYLANDMLEAVKKIQKLKLEKKDSKETKKKIFQYIISIETNANKIEKKLTTKAFGLLPKKKVLLSQDVKKRYMRDVGIREEYLKDFSHRIKKKKGKVEEKPYSLYKSNEFGKISNKYFKNFVYKIVPQFPNFFKKFEIILQKADTKIFSRTYFSMIILGTILGALGGFIGTLLLWNMELIITKIIGAFAMFFICGAVTATLFYYAPISSANSRENKIKNELPFVIVHMAAVAGSGAKPISMFQTVLASKEYPTLQPEIKKVVNYVNLFGYDLTTALRLTSKTTPSRRFKDMLDGMVSSLESGGSLKNYLEALADEAMTTYKLERKKYSEIISTYSDIYTGLLIAAPLLFFVTLTIIQMLGGSIAGMSITAIANIGTYIAIPLLNIGFMVFLEVMSPK